MHARRNPRIHWWLGSAAAIAILLVVPRLLLAQGVPLGAVAAASMLPQPGPEHQLLKPFEGAWDAHVKFFLTPDSTPQTPTLESTGVETGQLTCNGMWLTMVFDSDKKSVAYQGRGIFGFDLASKKYIGIWVDLVNPLMIRLEGDFDADQKTLVLQGRGPDLANPNLPADYRFVMEPKEKNQRTMNMYCKGASGAERLVMGVEYRLRKKR